MSTLSLMSGKTRIGIDVGGTFTDLIGLDEASGELTKIKVPTTPLAPEQGVINALRSFREQSPQSEIVLVSHSSTIATNALLGQVHLDRASLDAAVAQIERSDVRAVAVSFLHSYVNPAHEREVGLALRERLPGLDVTLSSDIDPEYREYERTSTTVVNALLRSLVTVYLSELERE